MSLIQVLMLKKVLSFLLQTEPVEQNIFPGGAMSAVWKFDLGAFVLLTLKRSLQLTFILTTVASPLTQVMRNQIQKPVIFFLTWKVGNYLIKHCFHKAQAPFGSAAAAAAAPPVVSSGCKVQTAIAVLNDDKAELGHQMAALFLPAAWAAEQLCITATAAAAA